MSTSNEVAAMRLALEALEELDGTKSYWWQEIHDSTLRKLGFVMENLRLVIADAEKQEPVAEPHKSVSVGQPVAYRYKMPVEDDYWVWNYCTYPDNKDDLRCEPLYTTPQQRKPLTIEQIAELLYKFESASAWYQFARAIEAAHGIKENT